MKTRRKALVSVSEKGDALTEFAESLVQLGFDIISSGRTAKFLSEHRIDVTDV